MIQNKQIPVFILCGGLGTRLKEETQFIPKPMVPIGDKPILWHIMKKYSNHGFRKFVLCLGYKSTVVKEYFLQYSILNSDFTINLNGNKDVSLHSIDHDEDWEVTLAYTGELTMTGARIAKATRRYLGNSQHFAVTYGDGVTNADLSKEFQFHLNHGKIGTVLGVNPPSRFGEIQISKDEVQYFDEKPEFHDKWINGGYFFFRRDFLKYLDGDDSLVLEKKPLSDLARDKELNLFRHSDFWFCMDTQRDRDHLNSMIAHGNTPWLDI